MRYLLSSLAAFLMFMAPKGLAADSGAILSERVPKLTRSSPWKLVGLPFWEWRGEIRKSRCQARGGLQHAGPCLDWGSVAEG